jgi:hypothetical protein
MMVNPYASHLGDRDAQAVIASSAGRLHALIAKMGPERASRAPEPGKWSAREIVCHLADCEIVFAYRLRQTLAEPHHVIQPFDQHLWAKNYAGYDCDQALALFTGARDWNLALTRSLSPEAFATPVTHPERGTMTFQTIIETMAGHDLNHIAQVERLV